jgi:hypothetical protein
MDRYTSTRVGASQDWPEFGMTSATDAATRASRSLQESATTGFGDRLRLRLRALDGGGGIAGDIGATAHRPGERHHVDVPVARECGAGVRPGAVDHVEHARGHARIVQDFAVDVGGERRQLGRLQDHRAAQGQRRGTSSAIC